MFTGWKFDTCFGLPRSKMEMRFVLGDRLLGIDWFTHINQQMVMAAVLEAIARMSYAHISPAKAAPNPAFERRSILRPYEIENGILWRRLPLGIRGKRQTCQGYTHRDEPTDFHDTSSSFSLLGGECDAESMGRISHVGVVTVTV